MYLHIIYTDIFEMSIPYCYLKLYILVTTKHAAWIVFHNIGLKEIRTIRDVLSNIISE